MDFDGTLFQERQEAEQSERMARYKRNYSYYMGNHAKPLLVRQGQPNDNVIVNLVRSIIDKGVSFLFGKELNWELTEGDTTPEEEWLKDVWRRNRKMTWLGKLGTSGGIYGHMFVKIMPEKMQGNRDAGTPRLVCLEPENVTVEHDPQDYERVTKYIISWLAPGPDGKAVYYRQTIAENDMGRWQIVNQVGLSGGRWVADPNNPDMLWPYTWPPVIDGQNLPCPGAWHGLSDIEDLDEQDALNYVASKIQRVLRYHSHPKTVGYGFAPEQLKIAEDETLVLPSKDASLRNLEMQSDLGAALAFMDRLRNLFYRGARVPDLDPATMNVGAMSGFALQVLYSDLLDKTEMKRRTYGDVLTELNRRLLEMGGYGADNYVTLHWDNPLPVDEQAEMDRDGFEIDNKLASRETIQQRRGIDPEVERERMAAEGALEGNLGAALLRGFVNGNGNNGVVTRPAPQTQAQAVQSVVAPPTQGAE